MIARNHPLTVDSFSIAIGAESVGLPLCHSLDTLLTHYLELVRRLRRTEGHDLRADDIAVLAEATGVDPTVVSNRLQSLVAS